MLARGCHFLLIAALVYPASSQVTTGTIIVFNFTKDRLVVAADSRGVNTDTLVPHDSECKISTFGHRLIFTSAGNARRGRGSIFDPVNNWDNSEEAKNAFRSVGFSPAEDEPLSRLATQWADATLANWQSFYHWYPDRVTRHISKSGGITVGAFAEASQGAIHFKAAQIKLENDQTLLDPIARELQDRLHDCWECGPGNKVCALGRHFDVAANFCAKRRLDRKIKVHTPLKRADRAAQLAVKIAELTIDAYRTTPGDVGGQVDAITLRNDGTMFWNALKTNCPASQD